MYPGQILAMIGAMFGVACGTVQADVQRAGEDAEAGADGLGPPA